MSKRAVYVCVCRAAVLFLKVVFKMSEEMNVYSEKEKKLASFETIYKEGMFSKPLDITITITAAHIYGSGYVCVQEGTKEDDPEYSKYVCSFEDITKVNVNTNNKNLPINVQCDEAEKGIPSRKRIILPHFPNADEIVRLINDVKADYDRKHAPAGSAPVASEEDKQKERERLKKAADDEFLNATAGFEMPVKKEEKKKPADDFTVADILGLDDFAPIVPEKISEPEEEKETEKAIEAEVVAEEEEKHVESKLEAAPDVDVTELDEIEEVHEEVSATDTFDEIVTPDISELPEAQSVEDPGFIPSETIEAISVGDISDDAFVEPKIVAPHKTEIHEIKEEKPAEKVEKPEKKNESKSEALADVKIPENGEKMSLEDFQTAVKKLKAMHDEGVISDEEFSEEKSKLMKFLY